MKQKFLNDFESILDEVKPGEIKLETKLNEIEDWSSLSALALIAMADQVYNISLTGEDVRSFVTVDDVYQSFLKKINNND
jgi:acyl carrier protein